jgi:hypothetical protein
MSDASQKPRIPHRKDADGNIQIGPTWESLIDRQIREAQEAGEFDNLPHQGAPLPNDDNPYAGEWGLAFHMLKNAGVAPPWVEANKELNELLRKRDALLERASPERRRRDHAALEELVVQINMAVARMNAEAPSSAAHRPTLVLATELAGYDQRAAEAARKP